MSRGKKTFSIIDILTALCLVASFAMSNCSSSDDAPILGRWSIETGYPGAFYGIEFKKNGRVIVFTEYFNVEVGNVKFYGTYVGNNNNLHIELESEAESYYSEKQFDFEATITYEVYLNELKIKTLTLKRDHQVAVYRQFSRK